MNFKSYRGKVFVVESSNSTILDEDLSAQKYKTGDNIPPGKKVGELKTIPKRNQSSALFGLSTAKASCSISLKFTRDAWQQGREHQITSTGKLSI
jgi:hypothetical protein